MNRPDEYVFLTSQLPTIFINYDCLFISLADCSTIITSASEVKYVTADNLYWWKGCDGSVRLSRRCHVSTHRPSEQRRFLIVISSNSFTDGVE